MFMAVASESFINSENQKDYKIWYLELSAKKDVVSIGVIEREELITSIFKNFKSKGFTNWRAFKNDQESSTPITIYDFISMNIFENTHFGNLPTLHEFQQTLNALQMNLSMKSSA